MCQLFTGNILPSRHFIRWPIALGCFFYIFFIAYLLGFLELWSHINRKPQTFWGSFGRFLSLEFSFLLSLSSLHFCTSNHCPPIPPTAYFFWWHLQLFLLQLRWLSIFMVVPLTVTILLWGETSFLAVVFPGFR